VLATAAARPTCEHVADQLEDQGEASTGGNWESVLRGLRATRAPHVAAVLDPTWLQGGGQGEATAALEALGDFDFVAADVVAAVTAELPSFLAQAVGHSDLPAVVVADERATRGHSADPRRAHAPKEWVWCDSRTPCAAATFLQLKMI